MAKKKFVSPIIEISKVEDEFIISTSCDDQTCERDGGIEGCTCEGQVCLSDIACDTEFPD